MCVKEEEEEEAKDEEEKGWRKRQRSCGLKKKGLDAEPTHTSLPMNLLLVCIYTLCISVRTYIHSSYSYRYEYHLCNETTLHSTYMLEAYSNRNYSIIVSAVSYTHLTLPTTPYV